MTTSDRKEELQRHQKMKDVQAQIWLMSVVVSILFAVYGWVTEDYSMIGFAASVFALFTVTSLASFSHHDKKENEIREELRIEKLEERIRELEEE